MLGNRFLVVGFFLIVLAIIYYSFLGLSKVTVDNRIPDWESYRQQVVDERREKDKYFHANNGSPIQNRLTFKGLLYFDPDPSFRITARLEPYADRTQKLVIPMTDGSQETYEKYAYAVFSLDREICRVLLLKHANTISLLFKDQTNGKETYGGGRYINIDENQVQDNRVVIDFNTAYNPYCAYNHEYACPLPPSENTIPLAIRAGEKYMGTND